MQDHWIWIYHMQTLHHYFGCWVVWWYVACLFGGACIVGLWWCWLWSPFCPYILCLDCRIIFTSFTFQPLLYTEMMILPPFFCTYMERLLDKLFHPRQGTHPTLLILPPECYHTIPCQTTSCRTYLTWKMPFHNTLTILTIIIMRGHAQTGVASPYSISFIQTTMSLNGGLH